MTSADDLFTVGDDDEITLSVHANPGAGRTAIVGRHGSSLKVRVAAPPVGGRANDALVKLLAEVLGVETKAVSLVHGERSADKRFRISGLDAEEFAKRLETAIDESAAAPGRTKSERRASGRG